MKEECTLDFLKYLFTDGKSFKIFTLFEKCPWVITQKHGSDWYYQVMNLETLPLVNYVTLSRDGKETNISISEFIKNYTSATPEQVVQHYEYLTKRGRKYQVNPQPKKDVPTKPKSAEFYMVTLKQGIGSKVYHESYEIAEAEAIRLSKLEGKKAYIMGVVGVVETKPITTHEVSVKKY